MSALQVQNVAKVQLGSLGVLRKGKVRLRITPDVQIRKRALTRPTFPNLLILLAQTAGEEMPPLPIQTRSRTRCVSSCSTTAPEATPKIRRSPGNQQKRNSKGNEASHHNHLGHSDFDRHVVPGRRCCPDSAKAQTRSGANSAHRTVRKERTTACVRCRHPNATFATG